MYQIYLYTEDCSMFDPFFKCLYVCVVLCLTTWLVTEATLSALPGSVLKDLTRCFGVVRR